MSEYELLMDVKTRLGIWQRRLETAPDDPDVQRVVRDLLGDKERLERRLFPENYVVVEAVAEAVEVTDEIVEVTDETTAAVAEPETSSDESDESKEGEEESKEGEEGTPPSKQSRRK